MWPETSYDDIQAEANAAAPVRRSTAAVAAEEYDGEQVPPVTSCGRGACPHWQAGIDCPRDPWCCERCGEPLPIEPVCNHGAYVCAEHVDACPECRYDADAARADLDHRYDRENGAA